ncbi:uncharacterized protein CDAR_496951 [Caerostris darwini]|uniref:Mutator-like transposase domain-containing protein n=1 Tax=Caerostris darwini TaxID=1538125 RepID=A0AAV4S2D3_9ARAC|nr:uncharacterized protein CDAR_496951 [Caerostris darwini]
MNMDLFENSNVIRLRRESTVVNDCLLQEVDRSNRMNSLLIEETGSTAHAHAHSFHKTNFFFFSQVSAVLLFRWTKDTNDILKSIEDNGRVLVNLESEEGPEFRQVPVHRPQQHWGETHRTQVSENTFFHKYRRRNLNLKSYGFNQQESVSNSLVGNRIIDIETLSNVFSELACPKCFNNNICLFKDSKYGLCSHFTLERGKCDCLKGFSSTQKTLNVPAVNARFVYGMRQIGKRFPSAYKFCATMNLPALSKSGYKKHEHRLLKVVADVAEVCVKT